MERNKGLSEKVGFACLFTGSILLTACFAIPSKEVSLVGRFREGVAFVGYGDKLSRSAVNKNKLIFAGSRIAVQTEIVVIIRCCFERR